MHVKKRLKRTIAFNHAKHRSGPGLEPGTKRWKRLERGAPTHSATGPVMMVNGKLDLYISICEAPEENPPSIYSLPHFQNCLSANSFSHSVGTFTAFRSPTHDCAVSRACTSTFYSHISVLQERIGANGHAIRRGGVSLFIGQGRHVDRPRPFTSI